ncbi:hypothetical protein SCUCBS95973_002933 [Sporothrix curviconia]|uniref:Conserved oligomeric Golgi complex subunit 2 n=1 Tax=Sporothrix curviconia TaxID=1260050 RepID=A0ABP0BB29_9PEZI
MDSLRQSAARGRPPPSPYSFSGFQLPSSSSSESGAAGDGENGGSSYTREFNRDDLDLPFPAALSRKDFLTQSFDATAYLSSLFPSASDDSGGFAAQRHQTLEDLRDELRERSSAISAELLELVNANYTSFLGLGDELKGGDEKVEDVRVALFGFRRSVEDVQARVHERRVAVQMGCSELGRVRTSIATGRQLLELDERTAQLEERLSIGASSSAQKREADDGLDFDDTEDEDEDEDEDFDEDKGEEDQGSVQGGGAAEGESRFVASGPRKLGSLARDLLMAMRLADRLGHHLPFVKKADERLAKCQSTLLLDLNAAVKEARTASKTGKAGSPNPNKTAQTRLLKLLGIYRVLGREDEIVRILKEK